MYSKICENGFRNTLFLLQKWNLLLFLQNIVKSKFLFFKLHNTKFWIKNCASFAHHLAGAKEGGNYFQFHPRDSSAKTEKGLGNVDPRKKEKSRLRPSLRSFFSLCSFPLSLCGDGKSERGEREEEPVAEGEGGCGVE